MYKGVIIGGTFDENGGKVSSVIKKLGDLLDFYYHNGGYINQLTESCYQSLDEKSGVPWTDFDCIIWAPDIPNNLKKVYPRKARSAILIPTKVLREGGESEERTIVDAITRIFKMHGNAVITIDSREKPFRFAFVDALGNTWIDTTDLFDLTIAISAFIDWNNRNVRIHSKRMDFVSKSDQYNEEYYQYHLPKLCELNKIVADKIETSSGNRFFGNTSTRCSKLFPSIRHKDVILVSKRNINKKRITEDDFVYATLDKLKYRDEEIVIFDGVHKPSVDTPIQLKLYEKFPRINYMIHGHAYIEGADFTNDYFACGDLREAKHVEDFILNNNFYSGSDECGCINLKNHGFLIYAHDMTQLEKLIEDNLDNFNNREPGKERIDLNKMIIKK